MTFEWALFAVVGFNAAATIAGLVHVRRVGRALERLLRQGDQTMSDLTALTAQVAANTSVEASAVTLIQGLAAQLAAAGTDPAKLSALQASLKAGADALAAAVAANTPAAPPPAPAP